MEILTNYLEVKLYLSDEEFSVHLSQILQQMSYFLTLSFEIVYILFLTFGYLPGCGLQTSFPAKARNTKAG